jgi:hypothetical protein
MLQPFPCPSRRRSCDALAPIAAWRDSISPMRRHGDLANGPSSGPYWRFRGCLRMTGRVCAPAARLSGGESKPEVAGRSDAPRPSSAGCWLFDGQRDKRRVRVRVMTAFNRMPYLPGASVRACRSSGGRSGASGDGRLAFSELVDEVGLGHERRRQRTRPSGPVQLGGAAPAPDRVASRRSSSASAERATLVRSQGARTWPARVSKPGRL